MTSGLEAFVVPKTCMLNAPIPSVFPLIAVLPYKIGVCEGVVTCAGVDVGVGFDVGIGVEGV